MIRLTDLSFKFRESQPVFQRVNLEIAEGEFVLVCGPTGSGKSTLLRCLNGLAPHFTGGTMRGRIEIGEIDFTGARPHDFASAVGFVNQQPEGAFVADSVSAELVYGMEQLGLPPAEMRERLNEVLNWFELRELADRQLIELSGGQQQRVAIAAAVAAGQKILVLDEPTSALDPEVAAEIIALLKRMTVEQGITVILAEHRLERALPVVDSLIVVHGDASVTKQNPRDAIHEYRLVPPVVELSRMVKLNPPALTAAEVPEGLGHKLAFSPSLIKQPENFAGSSALSVNEISVTYQSQKAVSEVSFELERGQVLAVMGANGSGKTSLLWAVHGGGTRSSGSAKTPWGDTKDLSVEERLCAVTLVPQRASDLLFLSSVSQELEDSDRFAKVAPNTTASLFERFAGRIDPAMHPRDLSAGQQLALVLAIQLAKDAGILILDEPTRGLDYEAKRQLASIIHSLRLSGKAVIVATHDIEFASQVATSVLVMKDSVASNQMTPEEVFGVNGPLASEVSRALNVAGLFSLDQIATPLQSAGSKK